MYRDTFFLLCDANGYVESVLEVTENTGLRASLRYIMLYALPGSRGSCEPRWVGQEMERHAVAGCDCYQRGLAGLQEPGSQVEII